MPAIPLDPNGSLPETEAHIAAAVACDPILVRMMSTLREAHARGVSPEKFARLLRLAMESAYASGIQCGANSMVKR